MPNQPTSSLRWAFFHPITMNPALHLNWLDQQDLDQIEAESIGWIPLEEGAYLHVGQEDDTVVQVVGVPDASMAGVNVLLLM
jgi:hypothetical protein